MLMLFLFLLVVVLVKIIAGRGGRHIHCSRSGWLVGVDRINAMDSGQWTAGSNERDRQGAYLLRQQTCCPLPMASLPAPGRKVLLCACACACANVRDDSLYGF